MSDQLKNEHYRRGYRDGHAGYPYHFGMRSIFAADQAAYQCGYEDGRQDVLDDYYEECKAEAQAGRCDHDDGEEEA